MSVDFRVSPATGGSMTEIVSTDLDDDQLGLLLSLVPDAAVVVDGAGSIISANARIEELLGYQPSELVGRPVETLVPERFRQGHRRYRSEFANAPRARTMAAGLDLHARRKDGTEVPVDISLAPISTADGLMVVAGIRDLSERQAAVAREAQLAAIVRSSLDGIISMTREGVISSWNPGATRLFGYSPADVVGMHVSVLVPEDYSADLEVLLYAAQAGEVLAPRDTAWRTRDGAIVDVALSISAVTSEGYELLGFSALLRDATDRKRAERQQAAAAEIRLALLSDVRTNDVLRSICRHARDLLEAEAAGLATLGPSGLSLVAYFGAEDRLPSDLAADPLVASTFETGQTQSAAAGSVSVGPATICAPINSELTPIGVLIVAGVGQGRRTVDAADLANADLLADQAALALRLDKARGDRERLLVVQDRERIARDLHDLVIQRLFAVGMMMQGAIRLATDDALSARVNAAVDDLDATIREIRTVIFELESPVPEQVEFRSEVLELVGRSSKSLGFEPAVRFEGSVGSGVPAAVAPHLLAVVGEALSNVVRHARATRVSVELAVNDGEVRLVVEDGGIGAAGAKRSSGLANLRDRARRLGGDMEITAGKGGGGTRLVWHVPC